MDVFSGDRGLTAVSGCAASPHIHAVGPGMMVPFTRLLGLLLARKCVDVRLDPVVQSAIAQDPGLKKLAEDILEKIRNREAGFSESLSWRFSLLHLFSINFNVFYCFF